MADRYWVGGTGNWNNSNTSNWSSTSGGASGASVPTASDNVFFNANSNTGTNPFTVTLVNTPRVCNNFTASGLDGTMTLAGASIGLTVSGNLTFQATNFTRTYTGTTTFNATTTGKTVTTNGVAFGGGVTFNGVGGGWTLGSALTTNTASQTTLTNGTLNLSSYTLSTGLFNSNNSNTRTIAFGTGNITCTGTGTVWTTATVTGLTTTGTQVVNVTSTGSTAITVNTGILSEANAIRFNFTGGTYPLTFLGTASHTARDVEFTGYAGTWNATSTGIIYGNLKLSTGMTLTASTSAMTFSATSGTQQITTNAKTIDFPLTFNGVGGTFQLQDALTMGSTRTATLTNGTLSLQSYTLTTGSFSSDNSNTRTIAFGTGQISLPSTGTVWDTPTVTGLTTTGTQVVNVTSTGSTGITVNLGFMSEANSISFNFTGGTYPLNFIFDYEGVRNLNFTGYLGTWTFFSPTVYGNLTFSSGMTFSATYGISLQGTGIQQITTNGQTINFNIAFVGYSTTSFKLLDNLTYGSAIDTYLYGGQLDLNGQTLTAGNSFFPYGSEPIELLFNGGTLVCTGASATAFENVLGSSFITTAGIGTGTISMTAATAKTFDGNGAIYNCTLNQGGAGALTIKGSNTFNNITNTVQPASVLFTAATTNTFTNFNLSGTSGNLITIGSVTAASHTLSKASGTVNSNYLSISQSTATGGATWEALTTNGNVDGGNNTGWIFTAVAPSTGNFLVFF